MGEGFLRVLGGIAFLYLFLVGVLPLFVSPRPLGFALVAVGLLAAAYCATLGHRSWLSTRSPVGVGGIASLENSRRGVGGPSERGNIRRPSSSRCRSAQLTQVSPITRGGVPEAVMRAA